jgi:hypothetical protein
MARQVKRVFLDCLNLQMKALPILLKAGNHLPIDMAEQLRTPKSSTQTVVKPFRKTTLRILDSD